MRNVRWTLIALLLCASVSRTEAGDVKSTMLKKGLPAKLTVNVKDQDGRPVSDAEVMFCFVRYNIEEPNTVIVKTDANGTATGEATANRCVVLHLTKEGYYSSFVEYGLWGSGKGYETGRWEPWNPVLDITLYSKLNRRKIPPKRSCHYEHLEQNVAYGFDMLEKDIVLPSRNGETADFQFKGNGIYKMVTGELWSDTNIYSTNDLEIVFQNEGDGIVKMKKHLDSEFKFTYVAPETGYDRKVYFHSDYSRKGHVSTFPSDDEYLIFRVSRKDEESGEVRRHYGIITRFRGATNIEGEFELDIWYYLNPDPEDRNIEYGP